MKSNVVPHQRKKLRLEGYDYSQGGYYHIVIVTKDREQVFGSINNNRFFPNELGDQVITVLASFSTYHKEVDVELSQVMPNHLHVLLHILEIENKRLGNYVSAFKTITNRKYLECFEVVRNEKPLPKLWQGGYYDHVIRSDADLEETWLYIESNPLNWAKDEENEV